MDNEEESVERRVRARFAKQGLMTTLGATPVQVAPAVSKSRSRREPKFRSSMGSFTQGRSAPSQTPQPVTPL